MHMNWLFISAAGGHYHCRPCWTGGPMQEIANEMEKKMEGFLLCIAMLVGSHIPKRGRNNKPGRMNSFSFLFSLDPFNLSRERKTRMWTPHSSSVFYCPVLILPNFLFSFFFVVVFILFLFWIQPPLTTDGRLSKGPDTIDTLYYWG